MASKNDGPGVPEAIPRTLQGIAERLGAASIDRLWIFPPRVRGRKESGLIVVSRFAIDGDPERRRLFTASYGAERTGKGLTVEFSLSEEGAAPPDRFPPVVQGVGRRAGESEVGPRDVALGGDADGFEALLGEWARGLLDETLWPLATPPEPEGEVEVELGAVIEGEPEVGAAPESDLAAEPESELPAEPGSAPASELAAAPEAAAPAPTGAPQ